MDDSGAKMGESRRQWMVVGGVLLLLAALVGLGWANRGRFLPVEVGSRAPGFAATDLRGRPVSLDGAIDGESVVLLNIWATWCGPCRAEMPSMQRLHDRLADEGLRIVAVSVDDPRLPSGADAEGVAAFARDLGLTFPIWLDPTGEVQRLYWTTGVPESFLIDRDGRIVRKVIGATEWDDPATVELVRRLLEG